LHAIVIFIYKRLINITPNLFIMIVKIPLSELGAWKNNYSTNPNLPAISLSAIVSLDQLKEFIADAEKDCPGVNGVRMYFVRYPMTHDYDYIKEVGTSGLSQVSLVLAPQKSDSGDSSGGVDYPLPTDASRILALTVCQPSEYWDKGTGLCPPQCEKNVAGGCKGICYQKFYERRNAESHRGSA
jgi:hypothetical protein